MSKKPNSLTWGLFNCRFPYHWASDFWIMLKRIPFVIKNGYYPQMRFEAYCCSIDMWKEILKWYRDKRMGTKIIIPNEGENCWNDDEWLKKNEIAYNEKLDKLLAELAIMEADPFDDPDGYQAGSEKREAAKDRFFKEFSEMFYDFWD